MIDKYLIVHTSILPEVFMKVVEVRRLIESGRVKGVSEAVKQVGISRSTYYKYKDYVFSPSDNTMGRKAVISVMLHHEKGVLSEVLNTLASLNVNILTINQNIPINQMASVTLSIDISDSTSSIENILNWLSGISGVLKPTLISLE